MVGPKYGVSGAEVGAEGCRDPAILFSSRMTLTIRRIMFPVANSTYQLSPSY